MADDAVKAAKPVKVMLLCNHVYLPEDPTIADWATSTETRRYDGEIMGEGGEPSRVRLDVHPDLAKALKKNKQAEIL